MGAGDEREGSERGREGRSRERRIGEGERKEKGRASRNFSHPAVSIF